MALPLLSHPDPGDLRSRNAMLREFFVNSRYSLVAAVLMIAMHTAYVLDMAAPALLAAWLAGAAALLVLRLVWRRRYLALPAEQAARDWRAWRQRAIAGAAGTGVMWASGLTMAFRGSDVVSQMYCATLACLTCVASVNVMAPVPRAFQALLWPVAVVLALHFALLVPGDGLYLALVALAGAAMAAGMAHRHAQLLLDSHALRFEREAVLQQLEEASAAKSRFIAAASHDLRQPLHALGLLVAQWRAQSRNPGATAEATAGAATGDIPERVGRSVETLAALVEALLDLSRLDSGSVPPAPRPTPLAALFERLAGEFAPQADERALQWRVRPTAQWVHADPMQLERMLRNLLSNALRCTPSGGVLLAARRRGSGVRVTVWDTGVGIAPADQQRVFEEFVRLAPQGVAPGGLGLGLAIVTRLARAGGHRVGLRSHPGRGSCFWIDLPAAAPLPASTTRAGTPFQPGALDLAVLVVDDDAAVREATTGLLERWGCRVTAAASLQELPQPLPVRPDRLVCDWQLGEHDDDGLQVIAALRAEVGAGVPALLVSGQDLPPTTLADAARGRVSVARKPLAPAALRAWLTAPGDAAAERLVQVAQAMPAADDTASRASAPSA